MDIDARAKLDREMFGEKLPWLIDEPEYMSEEPEPAEPPPPPPEEQTQEGRTRRQRLLARNRERVEKKIRHGGLPPVNDSERRTEDVDWLKRYRAFLRLPMVMEDGRYASFEYYVPGGGKKHLERNLARKERNARAWEVGAGESGVLGDRSAPKDREG